MKNVTITLDEDLARLAKIEAAKAGKSLSRWIGDRVAAYLASDTDMADRQRQALEDFVNGPGWPGIAENLPSREELHDRPALRRHKHPDLQPGSGRRRKTA